MAGMIYGASDEISDFERQGEEIGLSLLHGLESMYNPIIDFFRTLFDDIQNITSSFTMTEPQIPQINIPPLSFGGMVDSATMNALAEKGARQSRTTDSSQNTQWLDEAVNKVASRIGNNNRDLLSALNEIAGLLRKGQTIELDRTTLGRTTRREQSRQARQSGRISREFF